MAEAGIEGSRLVAHSAHSEPERALAEALGAIGRQLAAEGAGPGALTEMVWHAADPAAFHPSRRVIDLAYREVFTGIRPPVSIRHAAQRGLTVEAAWRAVPASAEPVWGDFSMAALAREYSPRGQVPDMGAVFAAWTRDGERFRRRHQALDLAYGPNASQTLDLYRPAATGAPPPVWVWIHGGYWQATTKAQNAHLAAGMLRAGFAVANLDYTLAPDADLAAITAEIGTALRFLAREAGRLDIDVARLHVAGHSAGGHLAAMAALDAEGPPVRSTLLVSGLFDLAPIAALPMGRLLGLDDAATIARLSPLRHRPPAGLRVGVAVGGRETDEFKRQSHAMAEAWGAPAPLVAEGRNHFDLLDGLVEGELLALALRTAGG
jgi:arylformamidase